MASKKQHSETQRLKIRRALEQAVSRLVACHNGVFTFPYNKKQLSLVQRPEGWVVLRAGLIGKWEVNQGNPVVAFGPFPGWKQAVRTLRTYMLVSDQ